MTYQELVTKAVAKLDEIRIADATTDAWLLLSAVSDMSFGDYHLKSQDEVPPHIESQFNDYIEERLKRKPVQLIVGETDFMGLTFKLDGNELIPRQDTEVLVECVLDYEKQMRTAILADLSVLDIFTGSGCIATSLAKLGKFGKICAADISEKAINNAKQNAKLNQAKIEFYIGDMFEPFASEKFDIITANPPYIKSGDIKDLMLEVKNYDPQIALDGGADGLIFYRRIAFSVKNHLNKGGALFMEIGFDQARDVTDIFYKAGFTDIRVIKDYSGNDRVIFAR